MILMKTGGCGRRVRRYGDSRPLRRGFADCLRVEKGSAAESAGVRAGDEITSVPGSEQVTPWGASRRSGKFGLRRRAKPLEIEVVARTLTMDLSPRLKDLGGQTGLLTLSSFRAEFFERKSWIALVKRLAEYRHLIVDVRENAGGSFVAMLRALSAFHCGDHLVGTIVQPRKTLPSKDALDDDPSDRHQIDLLSQYRSVGLRTFDGYGCFDGRSPFSLAQTHQARRRSLPKVFFIAQTRASGDRPRQAT